MVSRSVVARLDCTAMTRSFASQVAAITPLDEVIDGSPRPKPRRGRKPADRPPVGPVGYFCSNPQCDHATWTPDEQARHMAREFWAVAQALIRLAPTSPEALRLTGGVIVAELSDDECRAAHAEYAHLRHRGSPIPAAIKIVMAEYGRRQRAGVLSPAAEALTHRWHPRETCRSGRHALSGNNVNILPDGRRECIACRREGSRLRSRKRRALMSERQPQ